MPADRDQAILDTLPDWLYHALATQGYTLTLTHKAGKTFVRLFRPDGTLVLTATRTTH